jgi:hypothetical protein
MMKQGGLLTLTRWAPGFRPLMTAGVIRRQSRPSMVIRAPGGSELTFKTVGEPPAGWAETGWLKPQIMASSDITLMRQKLFTENIPLKLLLILVKSGASEN